VSSKARLREKPQLQGGEKEGIVLCVPIDNQNAYTQLRGQKGIKPLETIEKGRRMGPWAKTG